VETPDLGVKDAICGSWVVSIHFCCKRFLSFARLPPLALTPPVLQGCGTTISSSSEEESLPDSEPDKSVSVSSIEFEPAF